MQQAAHVVKVGVCAEHCRQLRAVIVGQGRGHKGLTGVKALRGAAAAVQQHAHMAGQAQQQGLTLPHIKHIQANMIREALGRAQDRPKAQKQGSGQQHAAGCFWQGGPPGLEGKGPQQCGKGGQGCPVRAQQGGRLQQVGADQPRKGIGKPLAGQGCKIKNKTCRGFKPCGRKKQAKHRSGQHQYVGYGQPEHVEPEPVPHVVEKQHVQRQQSHLDEQRHQKYPCHGPQGAAQAHFSQPAEGALRLVMGSSV